MFSKGNPLVSIVIPSFNTKDYLLSCLNSVFKNTEVDFEVIVVEGGSTDNSVKTLKKKFLKDGAPQTDIRDTPHCPIGANIPYQKTNSSTGSHQWFSWYRDKRFHLISLEKNVGPAAKRNYGIKKAKGKYLAFLDSDTLVSPGWLKQPIASLEKAPEVAGGQLKIMKMGDKKRFDSAGEKISSLGFLVERARSAKDIGQFDRIEPIFSGKTAGMILKKDVVASAGMFDPDYFIFWEEPDLCWRIWKLGYKIVFLFTGKVYHAYDLKKPNQDWQDKLTFFGCRNQLTTILKNGVGFQGSKMFLFALVSWLLLMFLSAIRLDLRKAQAILNALIDLFKNLKNIRRKRTLLKRSLGKKFYSDPKWLGQLTVKQDLAWYLGKGVNYLLGKPF